MSVGEISVRGNVIRGTVRLGNVSEELSVGEIALRRETVRILNVYILVVTRLFK